MAFRAQWKCVPSIATLAGALILASFAAWSEDAKPAAPDTSLIEKGEYLARVGDCIACHTAPEGKLFAGGLAMPTPFGTLYTSNVTPDRETGIGAWTADQFYATMHIGRFPDGGLLYPAMPFGSYTKVTRQDSDAIFAYLKSVPPVRQANRPHDLRFPFNNRSLILGWRTLFFQQGEYKPDPNRSAEWNRGAYVVEGLGHCSMCHTATNVLGGSSESQAFQGGLIPMQNWYAPSLTSDKEAGLGDWSLKDIADLLKTGVSARGAVYGPMADVVYNSLQYLTDADAQAMAVYLKKSCPAEAAGGRDLERPRVRKEPPGRARKDGLRQSVRVLSRAGRARNTAGLSAARQQPVDPDGIGGQPNPDGVERRLPARHVRQPHALWHAAVRAVSVRRRSRGRCHLHSLGMGQSCDSCQRR